MTYESLPVPVDLCVVALEEAARCLGPAFVYTLTVRTGDTIWVRAMLRKMGADVQDNPFAPYVNLVTDEALAPHEWHLSDGKRAVGSKGC